MGFFDFFFSKDSSSRQIAVTLERENAELRESLRIARLEIDVCQDRIKVLEKAIDDAVAVIMGGR